MLKLVPVSLKEENAFVKQHHRHHKSVVDHKFSVAEAGMRKADRFQIVSLTIVSCSVSSYLDDWVDTLHCVALLCI